MKSPEYLKKFYRVLVIVVFFLKCTYNFACIMSLLVTKWDIKIKSEK